jgi:hypothetical protein
MNRTVLLSVMVEVGFAVAPEKYLPQLFISAFCSY